MGISLERAVEIVCSECNSEIVSKDLFDEHIGAIGINLTVEFYSKIEDGTDYIFYRDIRDNDVVAFSMGSEEVEYRTVNIQPSYESELGESND